MTAFLSGEMKDTVEINPAGSYGKLHLIHIVDGIKIKNYISQSWRSSSLERSAHGYSEAGLVVLACGSRFAYLTHLHFVPDLCSQLIHGLNFQGGNAIWGDESGAPDDLPGHNHTHGDFFSFRALSSNETTPLSW